MKKLILFLTFLSFALTANVFAQTTSNNISAEASVINSVTILTPANLQFGNVFQGTNATITMDASGTVQSTNSSNPILGEFTLQGTAGEQYSLSFTIPSTLTSTTSQATLPFTLSGNTNFGRVEGSAAQDGNFDPSLGKDIAFNTGGGDIAVKIGGQVEPTGTQATETYTGNVTLNVTPTSF